MASDLENELESDLGFCGCGSSEIFEHVRVYFSLMKRWSDLNSKRETRSHEDDVDNLSRQIHEHIALKTHSALAHVYLFHFAHLDLTEHGSGVRHSWLTSAGEKVLVKLEAWAAQQELEHGGKR